MKYWLVLWWWSARWIASIWTYKAILEKGIEINEIAWTSMWWIIGASIALWHSPEYMEKFLSNIKFLSLIDIDLKTWLIKWDKIYNLLKDLYEDKSFSDTKIKLKIVATNLEKWEKYIFKEGKIADAVRASISNPIIFSPFNKEWKLLADGFLVENLPIEEIESKNTIAVSVVKEASKKMNFKNNFFGFEINKTFFWKNYQIIQKSLDIMINENEKKSLESKDNIVLIKPDLEDIEYYNFNKYETIIKEWYEKWRQVLKNIS